MKLHLPVSMSKSVLACLAAMASFIEGSGVAWAETQDLSFDASSSLAIDYADSSSIIDLEGGILTLKGDSVLQLSGCGEGDAQTYILFTSISELKDARGNDLDFIDENNAISNYFDITFPGSGFWTDSTLQLTADGTLQLVRHNETVKSAVTFTTRQTSPANYSYYEGVSQRVNDTWSCLPV